MRDEGKLSLKGDREMCRGVVLRNDPKEVTESWNGLVGRDLTDHLVAVAGTPSTSPGCSSLSSLAWNTCRAREGRDPLLCVARVKLPVESALAAAVQVCPKLSLALGLNPSFHQELVVQG